MKNATNNISHIEPSTEHVFRDVKVYGLKCVKCGALAKESFPFCYDATGERSIEEMLGFISDSKLAPYAIDFWKHVLKWRLENEE